jgi:hypothetical protein
LDQTKRFTKPFEILKGGCIGVWQFRAGQWGQVAAQQVPIYEKAVLAACGGASAFKRSSQK